MTAQQLASEYVKTIYGYHCRVGSGAFRHPVLGESDLIMSRLLTLVSEDECRRLIDAAMRERWR